MQEKIVTPQQLENPLVSVIVITYNSSKFILETLESVANQSYKNIEIIITDDCSTDDTTLICEKWIREKGQRFIRIKLIKSSKNAGITGNCNRGYQVAKGEWIKLLAGDDLLTINGIEMFVNCGLNVSNDTEILVSQQIEFEFIDKVDYSNINPKNFSEKIFRPSTTAKEQLILLLGGKYLLGSAAIYKKSLLDRLNGFDKECEMVEDFPIFVRYTFINGKIHFLKGATILHRRHDNAVTSKSLLVPGYIKNINNVKLKFSKKIKNNLLIINTLWHILFSSIIKYFGNRGYILKCIFMFSYIFQPVNYFGLKFLWKAPVKFSLFKYDRTE